MSFMLVQECCLIGNTYRENMLACSHVLKKGHFDILGGP